MLKHNSISLYTIALPIIFAVSLCLLTPLLLVSLNATVFVLWTLLQLYSFKQKRRYELSANRMSVEDNAISGAAGSVVSIHIAIHNEPPDIVIKTLDAIRALHTADFEVIVLDNNTANPDLWQPVQVHCERLGSPFQFYHRMDVVGAKAGALQICLDLTRADVTHVAVIDADYQVTPDFLACALDRLKQTGAHYVQCPQSYRSVSPRQWVISNELGDYFDRHAQAAEQDQAMLLTGTLSLICVNALRTVGGWPMQTITEDAELAITLQMHGFRGSYLPRCCGRGLLPPNLVELKGQRHRWIVGNLHTLIRQIACWRPYSKGTVRVAHWSQLTAWCSFITVPVILMVLGSLLPHTGLASAAVWSTVSTIGAVTVLGQLAITAGLTRVSPGFFRVRWTLALSSGWATVIALGLQRTTFRCTQRFATDSSPLSGTRITLYLVLCIAVAGAMYSGWLLVVIALSVIVITLAAEARLDSILTDSTLPNTSFKKSQEKKEYV